MIRGRNQILPNAVAGVGLVLGLLIVQPVIAEEKAPAAALPEASSESNAVSAPLVKGALPADDPTAAVWNTATQARFPMSPQVHWPNRILDPTAKDLRVRALQHGTSLT